MKIIQKVKKYQKKKAKKAAKEELKQMIPTLTGESKGKRSECQKEKGIFAF